jgi:site-specific recombinase XerD
MLVSQYPIRPIRRSMSELAPIPRAEALAATTPWRRVLDVYLDTLDSPHTRRAYDRHVAAALDALGVATLAELTGEQLAAWRVHVTGSELALGSQAQALAALRSFLKWARLFGAHTLSRDMIGKLLKTPGGSVQRPYQVLSEPEAARLLSAAASARDRALVALLLGAGLRAAELVALDVADLREDERGDFAVHVRAGKGRKDRLVPIRGDVAAVVRRYVAQSRRTLGSPGPLLLSEDPAKRRAERRMSTRAVGYLLERLCERAAIDAKKISPHSLRHTAALRTIRAGVPLPGVQKFLGHANLATTSRYVDHIELGELREALPELPS